MCAQSCSWVWLSVTPWTLTSTPHTLPPSSSVHGILQAGTLERVASSSSRGSSPPRDRPHIFWVSCIGRLLLLFFFFFFLPAAPSGKPAWFPNQKSNPCPGSGSTESQWLDHQGNSPGKVAYISFLKNLFCWNPGITRFVLSEVHALTKIWHLLVTRLPVSKVPGVCEQYSSFPVLGRLLEAAAVIHMHLPSASAIMRQRCSSCLAVIMLPWEVRSRSWCIRTAVPPSQLPLTPFSSRELLSGESTSFLFSDFRPARAPDVCRNEGGYHLTLLGCIDHLSSC